MFSLIAFILKLLLAAIMGGVLVYKPGNIRDERQILYTAMVSVVAVSLVSLGRLYPDTVQEAVITGASIFTVILAIIYMTRDLEMDLRLLYIFAGIIGIICGSGHVFYAMVLTVIVYLLLHQGHKFLQTSTQNTVQSSDVESGEIETGKPE